MVSQRDGDGDDDDDEKEATWRDTTRRHAIKCRLMYGWTNKRTARLKLRVAKRVPTNLCVHQGHTVRPMCEPRRPHVKGGTCVLVIFFVFFVTELST